MNWLWLSVIAALLWGLQYALVGKLFNHNAVLNVFFWSNIIECAIVFFLLLILKQDISPRPILENGSMRLFLLCTSIALAANLCICFSIKGSNPTATAMVEISYPFFVAIFTYLLFGGTKIGWTSIAGGFCIFAGVGLILWNQK
jgi:drug/metabolite transporter (DMT)-like permease